MPNRGEPQLVLGDRKVITLVKEQGLRYGENPHQQAAYYLEEGNLDKGWRQFHGKELSFNNLLDMESALQICHEFHSASKADAACAIVKHNNPCGVGLDKASLHDAYQKALACDSISAFGGIVAVNQIVDEATAAALKEHFLEVILAPEFSQGAMKMLTQKKNLRLIQVRFDRGREGFDMKRLAGGMLIQDWDMGRTNVYEAQVATKRKPTPEEYAALDFSWRVCRQVKSNAIVLAKKDQTIGIGAGQMSRVDSSKLAQMKIQVEYDTCVMASDAFFPFRDGIDQAKAARVTAVIQPGGSVRDDEVIAAANEHDMAMIFTGMRHFRH